MLVKKKSTPIISLDKLLRLQAVTKGAVMTSDDPGYNERKMNWNLAYEQHPAVIVVAANREDIVQAVRFAVDQDLKIAVKSTGHGVYVPANDCLLIVTSNMKDVQIDAAEQTAHVDAGTKWGDVLDKAQHVGLTPLLGSSPDVGVVGYTLGGGMGWLARKYGMAVDSVINIEIVTPNGELIEANETQNSDLFWALRGGGGNFGVVVALTFRLYPVTTVYGGNLYYPVSLARNVLTRFHEWVATVPDELTSAVTIMNYPPFPELPGFLRGQSYVQIRGCYAGDIADGEALMSFWRDWQTPVVDDFRAMSFKDVALISNDPVDPLPGLATHAWMHAINGEAIDTLVSTVPPVNGPPKLIFAEIRHAGGSIANSVSADSAFTLRNAAFSLEMVGVTPTPEAHVALAKYTDEIKQKMASALTGGIYMNFVETEEARRRSRDGFTKEAYARLQQVKRVYDPNNRFDHSFDLAIE